MPSDSVLQEAAKDLKIGRRRTRGSLPGPKPRASKPFATVVTWSLKYQLKSIQLNDTGDGEGADVNTVDAGRRSRQGFLDRIKGFGLVVPFWAPQAQILSHGSTGGFLTHCGWNSTLKSIVNGIPLIAWPLYAEQKMNIVILSEDLEVVLRLKVGENGIIGRTEISEVVKCLMEGEEGNVVRS
ncbi:hypothetical protein Vadar_000706 [Vaccinium darrowii]|uniref:Uncharacterized protein n=1 Tax=Vaccinium darrowii TaxID=229202 RepID=A0ACB7XVU8_9ERIC|nr:hypothetical protein Vadar_000706 [Vaccinium darrowii]